MLDPDADDLATFLAARISEEAALLQAFDAVLGPGRVPRQRGDRGYYLIADGDPRTDAIAVDPLRFLFECQSKREILRSYGHVRELERKRSSPELRGAVEALQSVLIQLGAPYADHGDFRDSWDAVKPIDADGADR